jgi:PTH1 family peptidyl-tRNA hydrolase
MNLSGKAVRYWMEAEKIPVERILVVTDDLNLGYEKLRLRGKGSDGGHNGLKDIQAVLGTNVYPRLRVGIGSEFGKGQQVDFVLGEWTNEELLALQEVLTKSLKAVESVCSIGLDRSMNSVN